MIYMDTIGSRIKHARLEKGWSQAELAKAAGVSQGTIGNAESGARQQPRGLIEIAQALGVSAGWLLSGEGQQKSTREALLGGIAAIIQSNAMEGPSKVRDKAIVPVVGRARGGDNGYIDEEQYPVGHGNGYLEWPTRDQNAFGLLVVGDSMSPRFRHGEYAVAEPNMHCEPGDDVYVALVDGRKLIKRLAWVRADAVRLESINEDHEPITILVAEVLGMYPVYPAPRRCFRPE